MCDRKRVFVLKNKENQRVVITKRLLEEAFLRLLEKKHIDKISVSELCAEAGINRATFYRHYNIPRDILIGMQINFIRELHDRFGSSSVGKPAKEYLVELCTYLYERADTIKIFVRHSTEKDFISLIDLLVEAFLKQIRATGKARDIDDASLSLISASIAGGGYFLLRRWIVDGIEKSPAEMAELIFKFVNKEYETE